jgi:hypothetical protein
LEAADKPPVQRVDGDVPQRPDAGVFVFGDLVAAEDFSFDDAGDGAEVGEFRGECGVVADPYVGDDRKASRGLCDEDDGFAPGEFVDDWSYWSANTK